MRQVTFRFNCDKLVHTLAYFSTEGVADLTKLKAAKLVYLLDKLHLWRFGRPVVGGQYFCMPFGPVPSQALRTMNDVIDGTEINDPFTESAVIDEHLAVVPDGKNPRFVAKHGYDPDVFSDSELQALADVRAQHGNKTAGQLVELTHHDPTWTIPNDNRTPGGRAPIPYHLFFEDASDETREMWPLIQAEQETCDSDDDLDPELLASLSAAD